MNRRRLLYRGIAVIGLCALGAYGYYAQRASNTLYEKGAVAASATSSSATKKGATAGNGSVMVEVATVAAVKLVEDINTVGTIRSNESVVIRPEVAGRITRLNFADGQHVKKGQLLVALDSTVNQAEVQQAKAELGIAKANYERNADLAKQQFISERARDESWANVQVLEAKLALAQAKMAKFEINAPFSGIVGIRNVSIGDYVKDGTDLINLEEIALVKVDFRIPEKFVDLVKMGQPIEFTVDALPGAVFHGHVDAIDPQVDEAGRSALLRSRIDNAAGKLKPGMFARVKLILAQRENALMIPEEAIVPQGRTFAVWKVVDGKAVKTEVQTGIRRAATVEIVKGLQAGDTVITAGQIRLSKDGTSIRIAQGDLKNPRDNKTPVSISGQVNDRAQAGQATVNISGAR